MECVKGDDFKIVTLGDLMSDVDLSKRDIDSIKAVCSGGKDIVVMSRPKCGVTSILNAIVNEIPADYRVCCLDIEGELLNKEKINLYNKNLIKHSETNVVKLDNSLLDLVDINTLVIDNLNYVVKQVYERAGNNSSRLIELFKNRSYSKCANILGGLSVPRIYKDKSSKEIFIRFLHAYSFECAFVGRDVLLVNIKREDGSNIRSITVDSITL